VNYFATADEMAKLDDVAVESGHEIRQMMELAGYHMVGLIKGAGADPGARIAIVCGKGNKGGDGLSAARHLVNVGYMVTVFLLDREISADAQHHLDMLEKMDLNIRDYAGEGFDDYDFVIDSLVGYRMRGHLEGFYAKAAQNMNESSAVVASYDLPTGIDATTGEAAGLFVKADYTLMLALRKVGMNGPNKQHFGEVVMADIGIPGFLYDQISPGSRPVF